MEGKASILWCGCARKDSTRTLSPAACLNDPSIAPRAEEAGRRVRITHPFHPLHGRQFDLVEYRCIYAESFLYIHDDFGQLREIPAVWTDFVKGDAFVEVAAGRSPLHAGCLLDLAELVQRIAKGSSNDL